MVPPSQRKHKVYIADHFYDVVWTLNVGSIIGTGVPTITSGGIVPIYGTSSTIQPGSWVSIYGNNLITGSTPANWTGNYPTTLGGTTVMINNKLAYLSYAAPTIINLEAPDDTALRHRECNGHHLEWLGQVHHYPGRSKSSSFSLLGSDAKHVAAIILRPDGSGAFGSGANSYDIVGPAGKSLGYTTVPAKAGDSVVALASSWPDESRGVSGSAIFRRRIGDGLDCLEH